MEYTMFPARRQGNASRSFHTNGREETPGLTPGLKQRPWSLSQRCCINPGAFLHLVAPRLILCV